MLGPPNVTYLSVLKYKQNSLFKSIHLMMYVVHIISKIHFLSHIRSIIVWTRGNEQFSLGEEQFLN
jgi:hypothetical protein